MGGVNGMYDRGQRFNGFLRLPLPKTGNLLFLEVYLFLIRLHKSYPHKCPKLRGGGGGGGGVEGGEGIKATFWQCQKKEAFYHGRRIGHDHQAPLSFPWESRKNKLPQD